MTPAQRAASVAAGARARQQMRLERNHRPRPNQEKQMTTTTDTAPEVRTTSREEIAANVRSWMGRRQVDQAAIAEVLGKSAASVSDRVNGKIHFRVDELQRVAALLEVTLDQLLEPEPPAAT